MIIIPPGRYLPSQNLAGKLKFWVDASNPSNNGTRFANSTAVSTWTDVSGNGFNATQGTGSLQPIYTLNVQNGLPSMRCSGAGQNMDISSNAAFNMQSGITVIFVGNSTSLATQSIPFRYGLFPPDGNTWDWQINISPTTGLASFKGINTSNATQSSGNSTTNVFGSPKIIMGQNDGTNLKIFINNTQENSAAFSGTLKTGTNNGLSIFWGPGGNMWLGDGFEAFVIQGATTAEINLLHRAYISPKWGIPVS